MSTGGRDCGTEPGSPVCVVGVSDDRNDGRLEVVSGEREVLSRLRGSRPGSVQRRFRPGPSWDPVPEYSDSSSLPPECGLPKVPGVSRPSRVPSLSLPQ